MQDIIKYDVTSGTAPAIMGFDMDIGEMRRKALRDTLARLTNCGQCKKDTHSGLMTLRTHIDVLVDKESRSALFNESNQTPELTTAQAWANLHYATVEYFGTIQPCGYHVSADCITDEFFRSQTQIRSQLREYISGCEIGIVYIHKLLEEGDTEEAQLVADKFLLTVSMHLSLMLDPDIEYTPLAS